MAPVEGVLEQVPLPRLVRVRRRVQPFGGEGLSGERHSATLSGGSEGILHGARSFVLQDDVGQVRPTHSISAGLDYPGVGPEHAWLADTGRAEYIAATDEEALEGFRLLCRLEGIIPALEPSHAVLPALRLANSARQFRFFAWR